MTFVFDPKDKPRLKYKMYQQLKQRQKQNYQNFQQAKLTTHTENRKLGAEYTLSFLNLIAMTLLIANAFLSKDKELEGTSAVIGIILGVILTCCLIAHFFLPLTGQNPFRSFWKSNNIFATVLAIVETVTLNLNNEQICLILADAIIGLYLIQSIMHIKKRGN